MPHQVQTDELHGRIQSFLEQVQCATGVPGIAVALVHEGRRRCFAVGGCSPESATPLSVDDCFHLGCTVKVLLAMIALQLQGEGLLDLAEPVHAYLPELAGVATTDPVRVRHLLSHTSGYRGINLFEAGMRDLTWPDFVARFRATPLLFRPGTVFSYEHTEAVILARIVEVVSGRDHFSLIRERVLDSLGIAPVDLATNPRGVHVAGCHDFSPTARQYVAVQERPAMSPFWRPAFSDQGLSTAELMHVGEAVAGLVPCPHILAAFGEEVRTALTTPTVPLPPMLGKAALPISPVAFGLGLALLPGGFGGHNGLTLGQCVGLRVDPARQLALAVGINATLPHLRDVILAAILADKAFAGNRASPGPVAHADVALQELPGIYIGPGQGRVHVRGDASTLAVHYGAPGAQPLMVGVATRLADGSLDWRPSSPQLTVGFFREPDAGVWCLMLGVNAYKRVAA